MQSKEKKKDISINNHLVKKNPKKRAKMKNKRGWIGENAFIRI